MPWKPGQSGNPNGRPPRETERSYIDVMAKRLDVATWDRIVTQAVKDAEAGDRFARNFLANYMMGRPIERIKSEQDWTPEQLAAALDAPPGGDVGETQAQETQTDTSAGNGSAVLQRETDSVARDEEGTGEEAKDDSG